MSRTILLSSGGSTDLKMNNSFSLDKECEMKAVETEVKIMKQCGYKLPIPQCRSCFFQSGALGESKLEKFNIVSD